jgi:branched-chain amino acid transport system permease protein
MQIPTILLMGITFASELTLLSIGFTLTYKTSKIPNFAHGTYAGIGIYVSYTCAKFFRISPYWGFPVAFLLGGVVSTLIFKLVISTLSRIGSGTIVLTISTLAIQIFLSSILNIYAYYFIAFHSLIASGFILKEWDFSVGPVSGIFFVAIGISIVSVVLLHYLLTRTRLGIAMRATSEDPDLAQVLGINTNNIQLFSWFLTGGLACLAGAMIPLWFMSGPTSGSMIITSIMAGSLLGGFDSIYGSILGAFIIGLSETFLTLWGQIMFGNWFGAYRPLVPMAFLIFVLLIQPRGLQGFYENLEERGVFERFKGGGNKSD